MFYYFLRARSGLRNRKREKQAFWDIKNNEIAASNIRKTFFKNLNSFLKYKHEKNNLLHNKNMLTHH